MKMVLAGPLGGEYEVETANGVATLSYAEFARAKEELERCEVEGWDPAFCRWVNKENEDDVSPWRLDCTSKSLRRIDLYAGLSAEERPPSCCLLCETPFPLGEGYFGDVCPKCGWGVDAPRGPDTWATPSALNRGLTRAEAERGWEFGLDTAETAAVVFRRRPMWPKRVTSREGRLQIKQALHDARADVRAIRLFNRAADICDVERLAEPLMDGDL